MDPAPDRWFHISRPKPGAAIRLFCFPYSGADSAVFFPWADLLPGFVEVCPVQLPGRGRRLSEPLYDRLLPLAAAAGEAVAAACRGSFALFGHSFGAMLAFEVARWLRRRGGPMPEHLFVSGCSAPQLPEPNLPIHDLPEPEFIEQLRRLNGTPEEVLANPELLELIIPILRADFAVCRSYAYQHEAPLSCPISAYGGLRDSDVSRERLEAWREQTSGAFALRMFPGDHFFVNTDRLLLLRVVSQELRLAAAGPS